VFILPSLLDQAPLASRSLFLFSPLLSENCVYNVRKPPILGFLVVEFEYYAEPSFQEKTMFCLFA